MSGNPKNRSLQAKTAARLAAIQLAYRVKMVGGSLNPETLAGEYESFRVGDAAVKGEAPNKSLLNKLLDGLSEHEETLDNVIKDYLKAGWSAERTNPILVIILKLAAFELDSQRDTKTPVIIDEYTNLAAKLLDQDEAAFAHATMKQLSNKFRA